MRSLAFFVLTAATALTAPAFARGADSGPSAAAIAAAQSAPSIMVNGQRVAGTTWSSTAPTMSMQSAAPAMAMQSSAPVASMQSAPAAANFQRLNAGGYMPPYFWGQRFQINNWSRYGFTAPAAGSRWVRYYDDALLVDGSGKVADVRRGVDWARYGESWDYSAGAPAYSTNLAGQAAPAAVAPPPVGYAPPPGAYGVPPGGAYGGTYVTHGAAPGAYGVPPAGAYGSPYVTHGAAPGAYGSQSSYRSYSYGGQPSQGACGNSCMGTYVTNGAPPPPQAGGACCGTVSYGCGSSCGPILVSETIVTTPPVYETRTWTTYETYYVKARPRKVYRRPPPGERG